MVSVAAPDRSGGSTVGAGLRAFAAAVLLAGALTACNDDSPPDSRPGDGAALEVKLASGTDGLDAQERSEVQNAVTDVLSKYVVDGFLGDYPREDFVQSFDSFTSGAARGAARDIDLLTGARFAESDGCARHASSSPRSPASPMTMTCSAPPPTSTSPSR